tara:strand:+ start:8994 stop:11156 length:2163 start_codon:yes stop_codon:yes gene_type:complete
VSQFGSGWGKQGRNVSSPDGAIAPTEIFDPVGLEPLNMSAAKFSANTSDLEAINQAFKSGTAAVGQTASMAANIGKAVKKSKKGLVKREAALFVEGFKTDLDAGGLEDYDQDGNPTTDNEGKIWDHFNRAYEKDGRTGLTGAVRQVSNFYATQAMAGVEWDEETQAAFAGTTTIEMDKLLISTYMDRQKDSRQLRQQGIIDELAISTSEDRRDMGIRAGMKGLKGWDDFLYSDLSWQFSEVGERDELLVLAGEKAASLGNFETADAISKALGMRNSEKSISLDGTIATERQRYNEKQTYQFYTEWHNDKPIDMDQLLQMDKALEGSPEFVNEAAKLFTSQVELPELATRKLRGLRFMTDENGEPLFVEGGAMSRFVTEAINSLPTEADVIRNQQQARQFNLDRGSDFNEQMLANGQIVNDKVTKDNPTGIAHPYMLDTGNAFVMVDPDNYKAFLDTTLPPGAASATYNDYVDKKRNEDKVVDESVSRDNERRLSASMRRATTNQDLVSVSAQIDDLYKNGSLNKADRATLAALEKKSGVHLELDDDEDIDDLVDRISDTAKRIAGESSISLGEIGIDIGGGKDLPDAWDGYVTDLGNQVRTQWRNWHKGDIEITTPEGYVKDGKDVTAGQVLKVSVYDAYMDPKLYSQYEKARELQVNAMRNSMFSTVNMKKNENGSYDFTVGQSGGIASFFRQQLEDAENNVREGAKARVIYKGDTGNE